MQEGFGLAPAQPDEALDVAGRAVAQPDPDDLGRMALQHAAAVEVAVLRHDREVVRSELSFPATGERPFQPMNSLGKLAEEGWSRTIRPLQEAPKRF